MKKQLKAVREFHDTMGVSEQCVFPTHHIVMYGVNVIEDVGEQLESRVSDDPRYLRCHLHAEECAEFMAACSAGDEELAMDALTDLLYVVVGTAVMFGWPLDEMFDEVQKSNMTKQPRTGPRLRDKGQDYVPPDFKQFLK